MSLFFAQLVDEMSHGGDFCLATIVNQIGSAPRSLGVSFLVRADGTIRGTIGGGRLEAEVMQAASEALTKREARLMHFRLRGVDVARSDMLCGGDVDVYLEPISGHDAAALSVFQAAAQAATNGERAVMITPIMPGPLPSLDGRKLLISKDKGPVGRLEMLPQRVWEMTNGLEELTTQGRPGLWMQGLPGGERLDCFLEPIISQPVVYLFGGGHVSLQLARLVKMVGFRLVVVDDRTEFANSQRFAMADEIWVRDFNTVMHGLELGADAYVVIITRGHVYDKEVLAQALAQPAAYVGMIGSKRKKAVIYQALEKEGFSKEELARVHSPIGLDIGAETPEEIAVSIVAELIAERARLQPNLKL